MMPSYSLVFVRIGVRYPDHLLLTQPYNGYGDTWYHTKDEQIVGADKTQTQGQPISCSVWANRGVGGVAYTVL